MPRPHALAPLLAGSLVAIALMAGALMAGAPAIAADGGAKPAPRSQAIATDDLADDARSVDPRRRPRIVDRQFAAGRLALLAAALGLAIAAARSAGAGTDRRARQRRVAVVVLGLVSYGSYYHFFQLHHRGGFDNEDTFHYYVGSKYFSELGYYGLYEATLFGLTEDGVVDPSELESVRDLRTLRVYPPLPMLERGRRWKREFTPERWLAFKADVAWFRARMAPRHFAHFMKDHGYHPPPVWSWLGGLLTNAVPVGSPWLEPLIRSDRLIVLAGFGAVAWAFGLEAAGWVAIVWGTGFLWRYGWVGDSLLRQLWLAALLVGLALLRRGREGSGGAWLTFSTLLRIFPGVFVAGFAAHALRDLWKTRHLAPATARFGIGCVIAGVLLTGASLTASHRGVAIYPEFAEKIAAFAREPATNKVGLPVLVAALERVGPQSPIADTQVMRPAPWSRASLRVLQGAIVVGMLWLFWCALATVQPWEAAALGFSLIPILSQPTSYYFSFCAAAALLGSRLPRIRVWLVGACALWTGFGLVLYREPASYVVASAIAVALSAGVLLEVVRAGRSGGPVPATDEA